MPNHLVFSLITLVILVITSCTPENKTPMESSSDPVLEESNYYSGPIIDMHLHADNENSGMFGLTHPPTLRGETYEGVQSAEEQKDMTLQKFDEHNIVRAMVDGGEMWHNDAPETILIGGSEKPVDTLLAQHSAGQLDAIAEMSPFYGGVRADDPSLAAYFELAEQLDVPVGFHIFPGGPNSGFHLMPQMLSGMRAYNADPMQLEDVLVKHPNLRLYIMHGGWPYVDDVKALMYAHPNVYVDIAVVNWILPETELAAYLKSLIDAGFGDRIMYGTDQMVWPQLITVGIESVNNMEFLSLAQKEDIFYDNAATFLRLSPEEIARHKGK